MNATTEAKDVLLGKTYELSLVKDYVAHWGMAHAVRELIQNALDSDSPFVYEFFNEGEGLRGLRLQSEFATLTPQTLLLGATSKAGAADAIGSFGEGYKIALLVLTREGYNTEILNGDVLWKPRFRYSKTFEQEILVVDEAHASAANRGLTFTVHGLTEADEEKIRASCLRMQDSIGAIKQTSYGDILLDQPGKLYVGSLYICETELKFGYNIKPAHVTLERDRQTVSDWDLKNVTLNCWYETKEFERIAKMIADQVPDVSYSNYNSNELVKEACYQLFRRRNPESLIAETPEQMREMIEEGLTKTVYVGDGMYHAVSRSSSYKQEQRSPPPVRTPPHETLMSFLTAHEKGMRVSTKKALRALIAEAQRKWVLK